MQANTLTNHAGNFTQYASSLCLFCFQEDNIPVVAKFVPGGKISKEDAETIAPIGNSPTFVSMKQFKELVPLWQNMSVAIFKDKEANEVSTLS